MHNAPPKFGLLSKSLFLLMVVGSVATGGPLHEAAVVGDTDLLDALIDQGVGIDESDDDGYTALQVAAFEAREDAALWLIGHGADAKVFGWTGCTLLHVSAARGLLRLSARSRNRRHRSGPG